MANNRATDLDKRVGKNLRFFRQQANLSQQSLANKLPVDLTFQQIQKYENGTNRVSASTLFCLSLILGVKMEMFFSPLNDRNKPDAADHIIKLLKSMG